ncbi:MAG: hypothetical protein IPJ86_06275 [Bacteroidetes bacterium]|nr:hypothetical protein [Bacteroidota bacterium]
MKTVLQILCCIILIVDSAFSASVSTLLIEIAYRNPLTGGNGVFIARHFIESGDFMMNF